MQYDLSRHRHIFHDNGTAGRFGDKQYGGYVGTRYRGKELYGMKQFIVLMAVLPVMMIFLMQFTADQISSQKVACIQSVVYSAKEDAKQYGCFTEEIKDRIKKEISDRLGIPESYITVKADSDVRYRYSKGQDRMINYEVSVRLDDVMAGGKLLGISDEKNSVVYRIKNYTASEKI